MNPFTRFSWLGFFALVLLLGACANKDPSLNRAPVEDRGSSVKTPIGPQRTPAGIENAGKPGYYTVKAGDRLISIALDHGQNWRDLQRWNNIAEPNRIEIGTVLRVAPPEVKAGAVASATPTAPTPDSAVVVSPVPARNAATTPAPPITPVASPAPTATPAVAASKPSDELNWLWPTSSTSVIQGFDGNANKGLDIAGKAGDTVLASADGRVVYTGEYRGYGKLVIIKHNDTYISAYAHNQNILVKEEQLVNKGQKIAEMGSSDSDKVKLHFEIRRQGKPVDPSKYLPSKP